MKIYTMKIKICYESIFQIMKIKVKLFVTQLCPTLCDPVDCIGFQPPLSMEFSRQEYWSE